MFYVHCGFAQFIDSGALSDSFGISRDNYIIMMRDFFSPKSLCLHFFVPYCIGWGLQLLWNRSSNSGHYLAAPYLGGFYCPFITEYHICFRNFVDTLYQVKESPCIAKLPRVSITDVKFDHFDLLVWSYGFLLSLIWELY